MVKFFDNNSTHDLLSFTFDGMSAMQTYKQHNTVGIFLTIKVGSQVRPYHTWD